MSTMVSGSPPWLHKHAAWNGVPEYLDTNMMKNLPQQSLLNPVQSSTSKLKRHPILSRWMMGLSLRHDTTWYRVPEYRGTSVLLYRDVVAATAPDRAQLWTADILKETRGELDIAHLILHISYFELSRVQLLTLVLGWSAGVLWPRKTKCIRFTSEPVKLRYFDLCCYIHWGLTTVVPDSGKNEFLNDGDR